MDHLSGLAERHTTYFNHSRRHSTRQEALSTTDQWPARDEYPTRAPRPGPLGRLAGVAFRNKGKVVLAWIAAITLGAGLSAAFGGEFAADYSVPGSDSQRAQELLGERFPARAGDTIEVVIRADDGVDDPVVQAEVAGLLGELGNLPHVAGVEDPYTTPGGMAPDGRTLLASLYLDLTNPEDMPVEDTEQLLAAADARERPGLDIAVGGSVIELSEMGEIGSEAIAFVAAGLILLVTFGSVVAAGLPLIVAISGLTASAMLTGLIIALIDVPDWTTALATMLGIALGIDYTLLMVTRFREWRAVGLDPETATVATLDTAGRAVMVAGSTVVVSMLGLFAMGLSFMRGAAVVTIAAILLVMAAAATLFPALLGYLGTRIDRLRLPLGRRRPIQLAEGGHVEPARGWVRWSRLVDRHSIVASVLGVGMLLALAFPFLDARFGFPDAGSNAEQTSTRQAYDMVSEGFGAGANGPLILVADLRDGDAAVVDALTASVQNTAGVAAVLPPQPAPDGQAALVMAIPETGPQHADTEDLVHQLRDTVIPTITENSDTNVYVTGITAMEIDSNSNIVKRLPFLIGGVVALSMLLLLLSFRSIAIPITAAVLNLLSVAAAYGVIALFLDGGWLGQLIGIDTATPMPAFIPVLVFAILFGLSMDYEVFLISRMRESWVRTNGNGRAIVDGLAGTGRVITAAAAIMVAVFAAFIPADDVLIKVIGVGMGSAILIDATIVRMLLVPAVMHWLGRANWRLPAWLDRRMPQLYVEGRPENYRPMAAEREMVDLAA
ncbi:MAG TPA: MMPL family transporter [Jiangellaceae bacterium]